MVSLPPHPSSVRVRVYLFVVIPFPWFDRVSDNPQVKAFVGGVTAAAAGAIAGACFVLARRAIVDVPTLLIGLAALGLSWRFKIPEPVLIAGAAAVGLLILWTRGPAASGSSAATTTRTWRGSSPSTMPSMPTARS
jgi:chromate transport protein ChrA